MIAFDLYVVLGLLALVALVVVATAALLLVFAIQAAAGALRRRARHLLGRGRSDSTSK